MIKSTVTIHKYVDRCGGLQRDPSYSDFLGIPCSYGGYRRVCGKLMHEVEARPLVSSPEKPTLM